MASIVGVGWTDFSKASGRTTSTLAVQATTAALADAGLDLADVDGMAAFQFDDAATCEVVATALGAGPLTWMLDWYGGGNLPSAVVGAAADAVDAGRADVVVCFRTMNGRSGRRLGGTGMAPVFSGVEQFYGPPGVVSYAQKMALWARTYLLRYGLGPDAFAPIATSFRRNAVENPRAMQRRPLTTEDYLAARWIADPFRLLDICLESDGAVAVVVASDAVARSTRSPVRVLSHAMAIGRGPGLDLADLLYWDDHTRNYTALLRDDLYGRAGVGPADIDVAEIYDCFTYTVCMSMEGLGLCEPGGTPDHFARVWEDPAASRLQVNTHGGLLSEAYIHGMNHISEAVLQLRGEAEGVQAPDARLALVTSGAMTAGSALVLARP